MPTLTIFAGINGAGKSTLYNYLKIISPNIHYGVRVNPDEILRDFNGDPNSNADIFKSGRIALDKINDCLNSRSSFNWETTTISPQTIKFIEQAKANGFKVFIHFIGVADVQLSLDRIKKRVSKGGHNIPDSIVIARHRHQFANINQAMRLVDGMIFYDNSLSMHVVGTVKHHKFAYIKKDCKWLQQLATETIR